MRRDGILIRGKLFTWLYFSLTVLPFSNGTCGPYISFPRSTESLVYGKLMISPSVMYDLRSDEDDQEIFDYKFRTSSAIFIYFFG